MRIRFRYTKLGKIRFTGQRDVARMWERALRRATLPLAYSEGFNPRPQLSFGLALPTGCESLAEYVDVALDPERVEGADLDVAGLAGVLGSFLPEGIDVEETAVVERRGGSLQEQVTSCGWTMELDGITAAELADRVAALVAAAEVPVSRERKGRVEQDDLRPSVLALAVAPPVDGIGGTGVGLTAELSCRPRGVRPGELVSGLAAVGGPVPEGLALRRACRTSQWIERDGLRSEPLPRRERPSVAGRAAHASERAS